MKYEDYIRYHRRGDAGVEERMIASLARHFNMSRWDSFRFAYYFTTTYHIPSALKLFFNPATPKSELKFRTDRRYVRIGDNFSRIMKQLSPKLLEDLDRATTTTEQYNIVSGWYFFGRYASLFRLLHASYRRGLLFPLLCSMPQVRADRIHKTDRGHGGRQC